VRPAWLSGGIKPAALVSPIRVMPAFAGRSSRPQGEKPPDDLVRRPGNKKTTEEEPT
jgi:hypothetical protein